MNVNFLAVFVATLAAFFLGGFWYSSAGFGKIWMKEMGLTKADIEKVDKSKMVRSYLLNFVATFVLGYVLAHLLNLLEADTMKAALETAGWLWLGFVATVQVSTVAWEGRSFKHYLVNVSYNLVQFLVMAAILFSM